MKDWISHFLPVSGRHAAGGEEWAFGCEGLSSGWAFFLFLLLMAAVVWAYVKYAPSVPRWRRGIMVFLRGGVIAIFLALLTKPVLNITINETVRQNLLVLLDSSQSMALPDRRDDPNDVKRAALAAGKLDPAKGLNQEVPPAAIPEFQNLTRWQLVEKLTANAKLNLWPRLYEKTDLTFYRFGRSLQPLGQLQPSGAATLKVSDAPAFLRNVKPTETATAMGDAVRQVVKEAGGQPVSGILLITDGGNNSGLPPLEAAQIAREHNVPLFIYGVGVTSAPDLILKDLTTPKLVFLKEKAEVRARIHHQGIAGKTIPVTLTANGKVVGEEKLVLPAQDGDAEVTFRFVPQEMGELKLEASIPALPEEISKENNKAAAKLRVIDSKVHVLLIEQEPRWDFRYLLSYLERDRRLEVRCILIDGEPGLEKIKNSPFLPALPDDRDSFFKSEILIFGDVDPASLGETRMKIIQEWVEQAGGGLIFHAGPKFNPASYVGTPLEALLPVVPDTSVSAEQSSQRSMDYFPLKRSALGESSPYLKMAEDPAENQKIWNGFSGVRWTAPVARAKPGAEVLLVDALPAHACRDGARPVFAIQGYGAGTCVYIGTDETYRWYSHKGEAYYSIFWGQIMESLSLQRLQGASSLTQLKTDRQSYFTGDKVTISGRVFQQGFKPLIAPAVQGTVTILGPGREKQIPVTLSAVDGQKGEYRGELVVNSPGEYRFATSIEPKAMLKFDVTEPNLEKLQTAMDEQALKFMAQTAKGRFLREEDINGLPDLLGAKSVTLPIFKKIELYYSPWWLVALATFAALEWLLRRLSNLK